MLRFLLPLLISGTVLRAEAPRVVTDIAPVHALAATVMQGVGEPGLVVPSGASPHHHAMRPSEARMLEQADLVIWIGPDLTAWLDGPIDSLAVDAAKLELMRVEGIELLGFRESALFEEAAHDHGGDEGHADGHSDEEHSEGHAGHDDHDDHNGHADGEGEATDPHIWLNPENGIALMNAIAAELSRIDPANADRYAQNAAAGAKDVRAAVTDIRSSLAPHSDTAFIVLHDAFHYFEDYFEMEAIGAISANDAATPGAARVRDLRKALQGRELGCAFAEPQIDTRLVQTVTEGMAIKIGTLDPLGAGLEAGSALYPQLLRDMAASFEACFSD